MFKAFICRDSSPLSFGNVRIHLYSSNVSYTFEQSSFYRKDNPMVTTPVSEHEESIRGSA